MISKIRNRLILWLDFFSNHTIAITIGFLVCAWLFAGLSAFLVESVVESANIKSLSSSLWWAMVTMTTVGYGDFYPVTDAGRLIAAFLMMCSALSLAVVTAKFSSALLAKTLNKGGDLVIEDKLSNHIIVCGWRPDVYDLLKQITEYEDAKGKSVVVLIANLDEDMALELKSVKELNHVKLVRGEAFHEKVLSKVAPHRARKIIILADKTPNSAGVIPTESEADARTVMTAITLSKIAKNSIVAAEIFDPNMDHHLKMAGVSEIIYSGQLPRLLIALGSSSQGNGLPNIFHELLDPSLPSQICTIPVATDEIGKTYEHLKSVYESKHPKSCVVGVLQNIGNRHRLKEYALREAQKTADVHTLIGNLNNVKDLRCNRPLFNPPSMYTVPSSSALIVIQSSDTFGSGLSVGA